MSLTLLRESTLTLLNVFHSSFLCLKVVSKLAPEHDWWTDNHVTIIVTSEDNSRRTERAAGDIKVVFGEMSASILNYTRNPFKSTLENIIVSISDDTVQSLHQFSTLVAEGNLLPLKLL